ncbi:MAG: hypothetical protein JNM10_18575 [Planctomycetia bacterium]|nr:hypothetical protein [Planctomycetia bacterium]
MTPRLDLALAAALVAVVAASAWTALFPWLARRARSLDPSHANVSLIIAPHGLAAGAALALLALGASPPFGATRTTTALATAAVVVAGYVPLAVDLARRRRGPPPVTSGR